MDENDENKSVHSYSNTIFSLLMLCIVLALLIWSLFLCVCLFFFEKSSDKEKKTTTDNTQDEDIVLLFPRLNIKPGNAATQNTVVFIVLLVRV